MANLLNDTVSILLNTTATFATIPTFAPQETFPTGNAPNWVSIGDINGDGKPDLATANISSNTVSILLNTTPAFATSPTFGTQVTFTTGSTPRSVSIGDINGDGFPDIATANFGSDSASILLNTTPTGAGTPYFAPKFDFPTGPNPSSVSIGDFNSDGKPDLATTNTSGGTVSTLRNTTGTGATPPTFAPKVDLLTGPAPDPSASMTSTAMGNQT